MENLNKEMCVCCDGTGIVEGEHCDDKQSCLTCNGKGFFEWKTQQQNGSDQNTQRHER